MSQHSNNSKTRASEKQKPKEPPGSTQSQRFVNFAREMGADESEENFNRVLKRVAKAPKGDKPKKAKPGQ